MYLSMNELKYFHCFARRHFCSALQASKQISQSVKRRRITFVKQMENNNEELKTMFEPLRQVVTQKQNVVIDLKEKSENSAELREAKKELDAAIRELEEKQYLVSLREDFRKYMIMDLVKRRFVHSSFEIYGGLSRLYDFGPLGTKLYENILDCWKNFFVKEERCLHVKCPAITPEKVLTASGHVRRFADVFVQDNETGDVFRLDHLISDTLNERLNECKQQEHHEEYLKILKSINILTKSELNEIVRRHAIVSPNGNHLSEPFERNLMFKTIAGSSDEVYLRPELSQSAFVNFNKYYIYNKERLPFAVSQIGSAFRNEATTRSSSITRLREFTLAEIQYFFDPEEASHPKFDKIKHFKINFLSACNQRDNIGTECISLDEAVSRGLVNQIMAYFFFRIQLFLSTLGVDVSKLRFRQHLSNELAHYAKNCWDAECLTHSGWLECVGISDRNHYDLQKHSEISKTWLTFKRKLRMPVLKKLMDFEYKLAVSNELKDHLSCKTDQEKEEIERHLKEKGEFHVRDFKEVVCLKRGLVKLVKTEKEVDTEDAFASVIEPSFGIERIMFTVFDHNFKVREKDEQKVYFSFPLVVSPIKCRIFPLGSNEDHKLLASKIDEYLHSNGIECDTDDSRQSIGLRYVKSDEAGTPFGLTVDFESLLEPHTVTLRDRDSTLQVRVPVDALVNILNNLFSGKTTFDSLCDQFPIFMKQFQSEN